VLGALRAPQQRAYVERVIGTIRREYLDRVIVFNEASLSRHLNLFLVLSPESNALVVGKNSTTADSSSGRFSDVPRRSGALFE
jgi:hypothetical protein